MKIKTSITLSNEVLKAIDLYKGLGYIEIAPFGDYIKDPLSLFMEKKIAWRRA
jgi:ribosomal protein S18 acetylase RimI-like enzyme